MRGGVSGLPYSCLVGGLHIIFWLDKLKNFVKTLFRWLGQLAIFFFFFFTKERTHIESFESNEKMKRYHLDPLPQLPTAYSNVLPVRVGVYRWIVLPLEPFPVRRKNQQIQDLDPPNTLPLLQSHLSPERKRGEAC
jgi:hypothetical protein